MACQRCSLDSGLGVKAQGLLILCEPILLQGEADTVHDLEKVPFSFEVESWRGS